MIKRSDFKDCPDCGGRGRLEIPYKNPQTPMNPICPTCKGSGKTATDHISIEGVPEGYEFKSLRLDIGMLIFNKIVLRGELQWPIKLPASICDKQFTCEACGGKGKRQYSCRYCRPGSRTSCPDKPENCTYVCPSCQGSPTLDAKVYDIQVAEKDGKFEFTVHYREVVK